MRTFPLVLLILIPVFFWSSVSCQSKAKTSESSSVVDQTVTCQSNAQHGYHIFIPSVEVSCKNLPLLVVIDPHGDGKLAVSQFKDAVQKYPAVVVGSNLIKNNDAAYVQEIEELIADVKSRFPVGETLFVGGFSGGARMSIGFAANHRVDGVIACGALAQPNQIKTVHCPLVAILGIDDFNFVEAAQFVLNPSLVPPNLSIEITDASHSWPEKSLLTQVFGYLELTTSDAICGINKEPMTKTYIEEQTLRIDSLTQHKKPIQASIIAQNLAHSAEFESEGYFTSISEKLIQSEGYKLQHEELMASIRFEMKVREAYYNALLQQDSVWWKKEVDALNLKIVSEPNTYTLMAYRRIRGFLGIVCYSLCNQFIQNRDVPKLEQILAVYRMLEPNNPDMLNFSAVLQPLKGRNSQF